MNPSWSPANIEAARELLAGIVRVTLLNCPGRWALPGGPACLACRTRSAGSAGVRGVYVRISPDESRRSGQVVAAVPATTRRVALAAGLLVPGHGVRAGRRCCRRRPPWHS
jgi:hypothetical protein